MQVIPDEDVAHEVFESSNRLNRDMESFLGQHFEGWMSGGTSDCFAPLDKELIGGYFRLVW